MLRSLQRSWFSLAMVVGVLVLLGQQYFLSSRSPPYKRGHETEAMAGARTETIVIRESKKWIVVDALNSPCVDVAGFTKNTNWTVVVVTYTFLDVKHCQSPDCVQLTWEICQQKLGHLVTVETLDKPSKLCGYLLAMLSGAEVIADAACDVSVEDLEEKFQLQDDSSYGLWYNRTASFNPYEHWGLTSSYPKDYGALSEGPRVEGVDEYPRNSAVMYVSDLSDIAVKQGVAISKNTCFYTKSDDTSKRGFISLNSPVAIGPDTMASLQTGPTIFLHTSLSFLFIPVGTGREEPGLFRTFWINTLKKLNLVNLAYYKIDQKLQLECDYFNESLDVPQSAVKTCVDSIECNSDNIIESNCVEKAALDVLDCMNMRGDSLLLDAWFQDMASLGAHTRNEKVKGPNDNVFEMSYSYNVENTLLMNVTESSRVSQYISTMFSTICPIKSTPQLWNPVITDILLVVVINYDFLYSTIPYMEYIHRHYFKHILYCGPSNEAFVEYAKSTGLIHVSFVAGMTRNWLFMYECVTHAMKLRLPVKGYLQIGEDVLVNTWRLVSLPKDQIWIPHGFTKKNMYKASKSETWYFWNSEVGQRGVIDAFVELNNTSVLIAESSSRRKIQLFAKRFLATYKSNIGLNFIIHRATDLFYIPDSLRDDYIMASELFRSHKTMIEIALPVIHLGLARRENVRYLEGASLWRESRQKPWIHYNESSLFFIHPFKLRLTANTTDGKAFVCQKYLPRHINQAKVPMQKT